MHSPGSAVRSPCHRPMAQIRTIKSNTGPQAPPASNEDSLSHTRKGGLSSLPFLDMLNIDGDLPLIIGLLLILFSEKADKKLLFALIYILL